MLTKGFTLIELVITLGIFAILAYAGTEFYIQAIRTNNRATMENNVRQNASRIMEDIIGEIRSITSNTSSSGQVCVSYVEGSNIGNLYVSDGTMDVTRVCNVGSKRVVYGLDLNPNSTTFGTMSKRIDESGPTGTIYGSAARILDSSVNDVAVLTCSTVTGSLCGSSSSSCTTGLILTGTASAPEITLRVQQKPSLTRSDFCAKIELKQKISIRTRP